MNLDCISWQNGKVYPSHNFVSDESFVKKIVLKVLKEPRLCNLSGEFYKVIFQMIDALSTFQSDMPIRYTTLVSFNTTPVELNTSPASCKADELRSRIGATSRAYIRAAFCLSSSMTIKFVNAWLERAPYSRLIQIVPVLLLDIVGFRLSSVVSCSNVPIWLSRPETPVAFDPVIPI
ncbi:hypothetical protein BT63DRAFT_212903 [Microthyrium microscopicum]|uniref:Uncharacterized protein n=1 Tax=Microthyrium microscopicum TaxID=703497 RepID=A0A6A6UHX9_9PEZI|nr:hypothetical protein BT63DRAFT_212903 [Microthyrium microscopicum]